MYHPKNKASMKVMDKIGMTCVGLHHFKGNQDVFLKSIEIHDFLIHRFY